MQSSGMLKQVNNTHKKTKIFNTRFSFSIVKYLRQWGKKSRGDTHTYKILPQNLKGHNLSAQVIKGKVWHLLSAINKWKEKWAKSRVWGKILHERLST
jgi:ABC-type amino acid transport substrate-binding protein